MYNATFYDLKLICTNSSEVSKIWKQKWSWQIFTVTTNDKKESVILWVIVQCAMTFGMVIFCGDLQQCRSIVRLCSFTSWIVCLLFPVTETNSTISMVGSDWGQCCFAMVTVVFRLQCSPVPLGFNENLSCGPRGKISSSWNAMLSSCWSVKRQIILHMASLDIGCDVLVISNQWQWLSTEI